MYFGPEVDLAIQRYNKSTDDNEKSLIYQKEIKAAFEKLVENIIHTFKFYRTDGQTLQQVQHEVVSFLVEKLPRFNQDAGKAFSYFSIVARNYCILKNKTAYKKLLSHESIDLSSEINIEYETKDPEEPNLEDFVCQYVEYWDSKLETIFTRRNDQILATAFLELFRKRDSIELFNKKALYLYIREMSNASTQSVTKMVRIMKDKYKNMYEDYIVSGFIIKDKLY